jgi:virulence-associated protein VapD
MNKKLEITEKTRVSDILKTYGDIAEVMELFGIKRVGGLGLRKFITRFLTVKMAAFIHRVPLNTFLSMVKTAVKKKIR